MSRHPFERVKAPRGRRSEGATSHRRPVIYRIIAVAAMLALSAAIVTDAAAGRTDRASGKRLIIAEIPFQCGLNDFTGALCKGLAVAQAHTPKGFTLEQKFAVNFEDTQSFTNQIQTSLQLHPAGLVVFNDGVAAQVPILKQACSQGVKVILLDNQANGLGNCESVFIESNNYHLGVEDGQWLIQHPPSNGSKQVGIVTQQPGEYASAAARDAGFEKTVKKAGYRVVQVGITDLTLGATRALVTNMLTAHPKIGAIFSALDQAGLETSEAVGHRKGIRLLSADGSLDVVRCVLHGNCSADAAQAPYWLGVQSVDDMASLLNGKHVAKLIYEPTEIVDKTDAKDYIKADGIR